MDGKISLKSTEKSRARQSREKIVTDTPAHDTANLRDGGKVPQHTDDQSSTDSCGEKNNRNSSLYVNIIAHYRKYGFFI